MSRVLNSYQSSCNCGDTESKIGAVVLRGVRDILVCIDLSLPILPSSF